MEIRYHCDLQSFNSYRVSAHCKRAFFPSCEDDFREIYTKYSKGQKIILGGGYNVILSKILYEEDFIIIGESYSKIRVYDNFIEAEAGSDLRDLSKAALVSNLSGFEVFYDIPSSVGGGIVMNAGANGEEIKDVLQKVQYLDLGDLQIKEVYREDMEFSYRNSFFQQQTDKVILKAWFRLTPGDPVAINKKMQETKAARWGKQPKEFPNAGSVFKRPRGYYVGALIDELNLKGATIGGAQISEKHGGFIININKATGADIIKLIDLIQEAVMQKYGFLLEVEQRII